jgi:hypothetical protein
MTHVEVLEKSVAFPFELNPMASRHTGIPVEVSSHCVNFKPWFLVAWNDEVSRTVGLLHKNKVIVLQRDEGLELAVNFMRPAKGVGLVDLDVFLKPQQRWLNLLQSSYFRQDAVDWLE